MFGTTLGELRDHIEALASENGEYYLVCGRTGDRPVPAAGKRFDDRATARNAIRATEQYRESLRRYDPRVPSYDLIVCQDTASSCPASPVRRQPPEAIYRTLSDPVLHHTSRARSHQNLKEFCHRVASAVFETLSNGGYVELATTLRDVYQELARAVDDRDKLCLWLLECMATEITTQLQRPDQTDVLSRAATRLGRVDTTERPLTATLTFLQDRGLVGEYMRSPWSIDLDSGARSVDIQLSDYALSPRDGRLPVLPIVLEFSRRHPARLPTSIEASTSENRWRLTVALTDTDEPGGLVSAPIVGETYQ